MTRDQTLDEPTAEASIIRAAAGRCLKRVPLERRLRLLGVRVGTLIRADALAPHTGEPSTARLAAEPNASRYRANTDQLPLFDPTRD